MSNLGDGINAAALPLLALSLTKDDRLIAGVAFASFVPWLVLSLPAGVIVDRYNRQTLMVTTNVIRTLLMAGLAVTAASHTLSIWLLYALILGVGICEVIFDSSAQAFLPAIVDAEMLPKANGRLYSAETITNYFLGQPVGAFLFAIAIGIPFALDAGSFLVAALFVASIAVKPGRLPPSKRGQATSFRADIAQSMRTLFGHQLLRSLALLAGVFSLASMFGIAILVKFATKTLGVSERWYGALLALTALGGVLGGLLGDRMVRKLGRSVALRLSYITLGVTAIGVGLAPNFWVVAAISLVDALAVTVWNIVTVSLRQQIIPTDQFGRVNSVYRWIGTGSTAIGALIGGQLAYTFGLRAPFVIGGVVILTSSSPSPAAAGRLSRRRDCRSRRNHHRRHRCEQRRPLPVRRPGTAHPQIRSIQRCADRSCQS